MPSWNDGETSSGSLLSEFQYEPDVPESIYDPDYSGIDTGPKRCNHLGELHKYVAFEGTNTGRRFLGCGCEDKGICEKVVWVDGEWPDTLKKALLRLWQMYDEEKNKRIQEGVQHAEENYKLVQDKRELEKINNTLQKELGNSISFHQVALVSEHQLNLQKLLRQKAEKERDNLNEHKKKLEYYIAHLLKAREVDKEKLKKISAICDE